VTASDLVATGLAKVYGAVANLESDPALLGSYATASVGNQAGTPPAGFILVKTWKPTATGDATPIAASGNGLGKAVNWMAWGV
jgi:hypothetical protein